jgi:class 3 adenylate cyclase
MNAIANMISISHFNQTDHRQRLSKNKQIRILGEKGHDASSFAQNDVELILIPGLSASDLNVQISVDDSQPDQSSSNKLILDNHGRTIAFSHGPRIHRVKNLEVTLPLSFRINSTQIELVAQGIQPRLDDGLVPLNTSENNSERSIGSATLAAWLETLGQMQRVTAGSNQLFKLATQAVFSPGGMDGCLIVQRVEDEWKIVASDLPYPDHGIHFRSNLVELAAESKRSYFHDRRRIDESEEFEEAHSAVVCPVLDAQQEVVAIVYGFRSLHRRNHRKGIRFLEAQFVQVVTDALSAGVVRLESETQAAQSLARLQQAFPPQIASQLTTCTSSLKPRTQEVTVLFCDLRGFSHVADRISLDSTYELLADAMNCFSDAVTDLGGTIIDFYGDGLSAFWNAPLPQPEHALLACQAAIEIVESIQPLNNRWRNITETDFGIGVGIHTGKATVGNSGSRSRIKYGPRGQTVNIASRLEQQTKAIDQSILISKATRDLVSAYFQLQSQGQTALKGHEDPIELFSINQQATRPALQINFDNAPAIPNQLEPSGQNPSVTQSKSQQLPQTSSIK